MNKLSVNSRIELAILKRQMDRRSSQRRQGSAQVVPCKPATENNRSLTVKIPFSGQSEVLKAPVRKTTEISETTTKGLPSQPSKSARSTPAPHPYPVRSTNVSNRQSFLMKRPETITAVVPQSAKLISKTLQDIPAYKTIILPLGVSPEKPKPLIKLADQVSSPSKSKSGSTMALYGRSRSVNRIGSSSPWNTRDDFRRLQASKSSYSHSGHPGLHNFHKPTVSYISRFEEQKLLKRPATIGTDPFWARTGMSFRSQEASHFKPTNRIQIARSVLPPKAQETRVKIDKLTDDIKKLGLYEDNVRVFLRSDRTRQIVTHVLKRSKSKRKAKLEQLEVIRKNNGGLKL